jgi:glycosyltransferase involved in cell wall biosynthesis
LIPHESKVLWILHQHRTAYDLWGHPLCDLDRFENGAFVRDAIHRADREFIGHAGSVFANSRNVARRLERYCGVASTPLYHPPRNSERFYCEAPDKYLFFPSRLAPLKRQLLVVRALSLTTHPVFVRFAGSVEDHHYAEEVKATAARLGVDSRIDWAGDITEADKLRAYARSTGVVFPPYDEDYGYVTLEAMLSSKPVITCLDSGGPLEFVVNDETGFVTEPAPEALAEAMDKLWIDGARANRMGQAARSRYLGLDISWDNVVQRLLS